VKIFGMASKSIIKDIFLGMLWTSKGKNHWIFAIIFVTVKKYLKKLTDFLDLKFSNVKKLFEIFNDLLKFELP